jgi:membrane carboxypeptidase/penicillin-binding protein PbpC
VKKAEEAVETEMVKVQRFHITNGAAMVTDPKNGAVLAMVGSRNYFDTKNDGQVNVTLRERQPGSSIKPLTYATAFEKQGLSPSSVIEDAPITYRVVGSPPYSPKNYDGKYHGKVTVRQSLGSSYNIPAVKTLASVGVPAVVEKGRQMGITSWTEAAASRFGLSLTLGGGEVKMADMTQMYGTFANGGVTVPLNPILQVKNYKGEVIYTNPCRDENTLCGGNKVLDPRIAYQITSVLSDNAARAPAFGTNSVLNIPKQQVAVKTGTTNSMRDNWTFGYTDTRLVGAWVGNNDNSAMSYVASGITGASPIWNTIMKSLLDENNPHTFAQPSDLVKVKICVTTGTLPCSACKFIREESFIPGTEPKNACRDEQFASPSPNPNGEPGRDQILNGISR